MKDWRPQRSKFLSIMPLVIDDGEVCVYDIVDGEWSSDRYGDDAGELGSKSWSLHDDTHVNLEFMFMAFKMLIQNM